MAYSSYRLRWLKILMLSLVCIIYLSEAPLIAHFDVIILHAEPLEIPFYATSLLTKVFTFSMGIRYGFRGIHWANSAICILMCFSGLMFIVWRNRKPTWPFRDNHECIVSWATYLLVAGIELFSSTLYNRLMHEYEEGIETRERVRLAN
jgi:hypothetical protein